MQKRKFTGAQKASIVLSILSQQKTVAEVCREFTLGPGLIHKWKEHFLKNAPAIFETTNSENEKDRQVKKYEYVISKLTTQNDFLERVLSVTK
jgi:transposase-like protein